MHKTFSAFRKIALGISLLFLAVLGVAARAQEVTGAIQGTITDPSGAAVADATVTASSTVLGTPAVAHTDSKGFYRLNGLPPGTYTVTVEGMGMSAKATNLKLSAGDLPNLNLRAVAGASTSIDVTDSVATVDVTQSKVETVVTSEIIQGIPKMGRSFQSLLTYAPGVRQEPLQSLAQVNGTTTPNAAGNANNGGSSSRTNGFQIDGASDSENLYLMDGINISNIQGGGIGLNVPQEFIQEVSVKSSGIDAKFGGAIGGVVNVIPARGTNSWHGSLFMYYRTSWLNANDQCAINATCGLRYVSGTASTSGNYSVTPVVPRKDAPAEYFIGRQDHYKYVDPGFTLGGPVFTDKVHLFLGYAPTYQRTRRTVASNVAGQGGDHTYYNGTDGQYAYARVDYAPTGKLRIFGGWEYAYLRNVGQLPTTPDSKIGQTNNQLSTNPVTFRPDTGYVNPGASYSTGVDYSLGSKTLLTARFGYFFTNLHSLGVASGLRYVYQSAATAATTATLNGSIIPSAYQNTSGYSNLAANQPTFFNAYKRKDLRFDAQHIFTGLAGTHVVQGGYALALTNNAVKTLYDYALVNIYWSQAYTVGIPGSCDANIAGNKTAYGAGQTDCRGNYGYFIVRDGTDVIGNGKDTAHSLYVQDDWTVGKGLTINAGIRFDKEFLPPYAAGAPSIGFSWTSKIAPRIGGAWAFAGNKGKLYASYGKFYDILKFSLPQGSFGGNYWHDCVYTLDNPNINLIQPTAPIAGDGFRHSCPTAGMAPGVPSAAAADVSGNAAPGRFIENNDLRATNNSSNDPGVDPNIKPTSQHETTFGAEYALRPSLSFKARWVRKRLDQTTEDIGVNDNLGFYIGNPGSAYGDLLHRALPHVYDVAVAGGTNPATVTGYLNPTGICPSCPNQPRATREYDGLEFRVEKTAPKYFFTAFYTYSKLRGNYPGLTSTFVSDGSGGRHNPNNNRSFDMPNMQFDAYGKPFEGPLPTDRPHSLNIFGNYRLKTFLGETSVGLSQYIASGTPVSTCFPIGGSSTSACQFVEGQGGWVNFGYNTNTGDLTLTSIEHGRRTPVFSETGMNFSHYVHVSKEHENRRLGGEINASNLLNQHTAVAYNQTPLTAAAQIVSGATPANPIGTNFLAEMTGYNYTDVSNGVTSGSARRILSNQYGLPNVFQPARQIRLKIMYQF